MKEWWQYFFIPVTADVMFAPMKNATRIEAREILRQIKVPKKGKILDLACGTGRHSVELARRSFSVVGLDYSREFLKRARKSKAKVHRIRMQQNVYTHKKLKSLLIECGFKIEKTWGLLHGGEFKSTETWHQTIVALKPSNPQKR